MLCCVVLCCVVLWGGVGQRVFGLDIRVLARVMVFACRVEGVRVWRVLARVTVSACVFGARVPLARACWIGLRAWRTPGVLLAHS